MEIIVLRMLLAWYSLKKNFTSLRLGLFVVAEAGFINKSQNQKTILRRRRSEQERHQGLTTMTDSPL